MAGFYLQLIQLLEIYKDEIFCKKKGKFYNGRKAAAWKNIHSALLTSGLIERRKTVTAIKSAWYRITRTAKQRLKELLRSGFAHELSEKDRRVLALLDLKAWQYMPVREFVATGREVIAEKIEYMAEPVPEMANEGNMYVERKYQLSDADLERKILEQKWRLNELKLLRMKYEILQMEDKPKKQEFLRLL